MALVLIADDNLKIRELVQFHEQAGFGVGAEDHLLKPVILRELIHRVNALVSSTWR
jgi:CheY-like chemotaxis protein